MKICHPIRSFSLAAVMLLSAPALQAVAPIALPTAPLYLAGGVAPNLVVTLDDSGSMTWGYVPDSMGKNAKVEAECKSGGAKDVSILWDYDGTETKRYFLSADSNAQYYNPKITYLPPLKADGTSYSTSFGSAYANGFDTGSVKVDLASAYQPTFGLQPKSNECYAKHPAIDSGSGKQFSSDEAQVPAYYYEYQTGGTGCTGASISSTNEACYVYTAVGAAEQQNFANWYSFYRTRNLTTVTAATRAFNNLPGTIRLAWQSLSSCNNFGSATCTGWDGVSKDHRIRTLSATGHKQNFYDWLARLPANGTTPLRAALGRVGEYYSTSSTTDKNNPYAEDPQVTIGTQHSCRSNYTIMMTDGIWNGSAASNNNTDNENVDNTAKTLPDGTSYTASAPYKDDNYGALADVAFYYWAKDLRTDTGMVNNVPRSPRALDKIVEDGGTIPTATYFDPKNDPASWQHMVTYTVGLGLTTTFPTLTPALSWTGNTYTGSYPSLASSGGISWPVAGDNKPGNVADLWHAALNGRGLFFSAEDPKTLSDAMQEMVNDIISRSSSAASIATNSKKLDTTTNIYQGSFDSGNWTGELEAFSLTEKGALAASQWKASTKIPAAADRNIKTLNVSTGMGMDFSGAVDTSLGLTADVVNYLRGDKTNEQSAGGTFRNRSSLLGDIINSDPLFVSAESFGYDKLSGAEGTDYVTYLSGKASKTAVIYVGANDGMLHAFKASDGVELFAYVPALVYPNLVKLTQPNYSHSYFVDGAPALGDVYYGGSAWKTVLVTPLGAGGRGVFALDISKNFGATAFAGTDVLWEFDGSSVSKANDMGYPVGGASVGRFQDGKYYAVFGNGYGSANCKSALFMVQVDDPSNVKFFDTGVGACTSIATQNGMSTPSLVDYDGDKIIDAIYAGDLQGRLWKWDVISATNSVWDFAVGGNPMFAAVGPSGNIQPITAPVEVGPVPSSATGKAMVFFGTGRYLLSGDENDKSKQTFYGLLDDGTAIASNKLVAQTIVYESTTARVVSANTINWASKDGWYLNLVPPSGTATGERVLSVPLLRFGRVIFNTSIPSADPCVLGGTGWLMELDAATGGNLPYSALDMNNDGLFDSADYVTYTDSGGNVVKAPVAGKASGSMSLNQPTVITAGGKEYKFNSDIKKGISVTTEKSGSSNPRSSWRQLQ
jgi:type IV pilus assembly protein PilY1